MAEVSAKLVPLLEEIKASREAFNPENMTVMRNTVEELKSLMTEVRSLLDQEVNKPVVFRHGTLCRSESRPRP